MALVTAVSSTAICVSRRDERRKPTRAPVDLEQLAADEAAIEIFKSEHSVAGRRCMRRRRALVGMAVGRKTCDRLARFILDSSSQLTRTIGKFGSNKGKGVRPRERTGRADRSQTGIRACLELSRSPGLAQEPVDRRTWGEGGPTGASTAEKYARVCTEQGSFP